MDNQKILQAIQEEIDCHHIEVQGDGHHFNALVVSDDFLDKNLVKRQQMVYGCVQDWIASGELHALSIKAKTPAEWQN